MGPSYWNLKQKVSARIENIALYRKLTGDFEIPKDRGYWCLSNLQPQEEGAEIVQMLSTGLISSKSQFCGVDWDKDIIEKNKQWHPEANWYCGDWLSVIRRENFNPSLVYLDTTQFADRKAAAKLLSSTMHLCPLKTLLLANVMLNDPRSSIKFDPTALIRMLPYYVAPLELNKWQPKVENFMYDATNKTNMITYALFKE